MHAAPAPPPRTGCLSTMLHSAVLLTLLAASAVVGSLAQTSVVNRPVIGVLSQVQRQRKTFCVISVETS